MILVDTHVVIWMTQERAKLSAASIRALTGSRDEGGLAIADITLREIALLVTKGYVRVSKPLDVYIAFVESLFRVLPMDGRIAIRSAQFPATYPNDPADQLIGATAIVHGLRLVTRDKGIRASGEVDCVW